MFQTLRDTFMWFKGTGHTTIVPVGKLEPEPVGSVMRHLDDLAKGQQGHDHTVWVSCHCYLKKTLSPDAHTWIRRDGSRLMPDTKIPTAMSFETVGKKHKVFVMADSIAVPSGSTLNAELVKEEWSPAYTFEPGLEWGLPVGERWTVLRRRLVPCGVCQGKTAIRCPKCEQPVCIICAETKYGGVRKHQC